ncbi:MAG: hypothetical protein HY376_02970 [Candidatus Blackburnbacteria bacterium]|nr:hypothetical protein [Candidatus Blackburnbacteria bacterium]
MKKSVVFLFVFVVVAIVVTAIWQNSPPTNFVEDFFNDSYINRSVTTAESEVANGSILLSIDNSTANFVDEFERVNVDPVLNFGLNYSNWVTRWCYPETGAGCADVSATKPRNNSGRLRLSHGTGNPTGVQTNFSLKVGESFIIQNITSSERATISVLITNNSDENNVSSSDTTVGNPTNWAEISLVQFTMNQSLKESTINMVYGRVENSTHINVSINGYDFSLVDVSSLKGPNNKSLYVNAQIGAGDSYTVFIDKILIVTSGIFKNTTIVSNVLNASPIKAVNVSAAFDKNASQVQTNIALCQTFISNCSVIAGVGYNVNRTYAESLEGLYYNLTLNTSDGLRTVRLDKLNINITLQSESFFRSLQNNASSPTLVRSNVSWGIVMKDSDVVSAYRFASNESGTFINTTDVFVNSPITMANASIIVNHTLEGKNVCGQFWFNDSGNNFNQTSFSCFNVRSIFPTLNANGTNFSIIKKGQAGLFFFNVTDDVNLSRVVVEHNMTIDGVPTNITCNAENTLSYNCTVNITMVFGNLTPFYVKVFMNDTSNQLNNTAPKAVFNTSNTAPIANDIKINNTPITSTKDSNGSASSSDVDNNSQSIMAWQWFVNGVVNKTGDNRSLFLSGNYTTDDTLIVSIRVNDDTDWSEWANSSTVTVGDATAPTIPGFFVNATSILTTETLNFTVNATDASSNIQTMNFSLITPTAVLDRSFTIPSGQKSVNVSYKLFSGSETATAGTYNVSAVRVVDSSDNTNTTPITTINFTLTIAGGGGTGGTTGGGGGPSTPIVCGVGEADVNGTCVPTSNLTRAPRSGDGVCDGLAGEDPFNEPACTFGGSLTCSDPTQPCIWRNVVARSVVFLAIGGLILLQFTTGAKGKVGGFWRKIKGKFGRE